MNLLVENTIKYDGGLYFYVNWLLVDLEAIVLNPNGRLQEHCVEETVNY
jgi:hypothetical protein